MTPKRPCRVGGPFGALLSRLSSSIQRREPSSVRNVQREWIDLGMSQRPFTKRGRRNGTLNVGDFWHELRRLRQ
jgi:hypothetical protein